MTTATAHRTDERSDTQEVRFHAMGTEAHLIVVGGSPALLEHARQRLEELEARWSRFRPTSEVCRLNAAGEVPVVVSDATFALVEHACEAWRQTAGAFDPTVLPALERVGYDRDFDSVNHDDTRELPAGVPSPGCAGIMLDAVVRAVRLPNGVRLDFGGIAKGFAADLLVAELRDAGAAGACVNLGGDLRVSGEPPSGGAWVVQVEAPSGVGGRADRDQPLLSLADGAVATTSRCRRVWRRDGQTQHHVIDPRTGSPAVTRWITATVVAGSAVDAEPLAKAALLAATMPDADALLRERSASGVLIDATRHAHSTSGMDAFLVAPPLVAHHLSPIHPSPIHPSPIEGSTT